MYRIEFFGGESGGWWKRCVFYRFVIFRYLLLWLLMRKSKCICVASYEDASRAAMFVHWISGWIFYKSKMQRKQKSQMQVELRLVKEDVYVW